MIKMKSGQQKRKPLSRFPFFDSSFLEKKLELVVEGYGPSILVSLVRIVSTDIECIFTMEEYILLESYISHCIPECNIGCIIVAEILQDIGLEACAAEVYAFVNIVVCYINSEGTRFLQVQLAIADTCVPSGIIAIVIGGVLPVFTEYAEVLNRNGQVCTHQFIAGSCISFLVACELNVVNAEFSNVQISFAACIECILIYNFIFKVGLIEAAITSGQVNFLSCMECYLSSISAEVITIQPAALVTKYYRLTAETNGCNVAEVMVCKQLAELYISIIIVLEIKFRSQLTLYVSGVIDLTLYVDSHTAVPGITLCGIVLITHTSIAGPVNVADLLFKVGYANAQVCEFVSIFASEFVQCCSLLPIQLIFLSEHAGNDLSHFITGDVSFALEGAIRITFNDALFGQVFNCLISPVVRGYIREWICSVCRYASCECCYCSNCENLFHVSSLL